MITTATAVLEVSVVKRNRSRERVELEDKGKTEKM